VAEVQDVVVRVRVDLDLAPLRELRDLLTEILDSADSAQRPQDDLDKWMNRTFRSGDSMDDLVSVLTGQKLVAKE